MGLGSRGLQFCCSCFGLVVCRFARYAGFAGQGWFASVVTVYLIGSLVCFAFFC